MAATTAPRPRRAAVARAGATSCRASHPCLPSPRGLAASEVRQGWVGEVKGWAETELYRRGEAWCRKVNDTATARGAQRRAKGPHPVSARSQPTGLIHPHSPHEPMTEVETYATVGVAPSAFGQVGVKLVRRSNACGAQMLAALECLRRPLPFQHLYFFLLIFLFSPQQGERSKVPRNRVARQL